jgi:hypothetical protein
MAANTSPIFPLTPNIGQAQISTANAGRDGTGTIGTVFTPGANGSRIERAFFQAAVTTTAGMVRIFLHDGTNFRLISEIPVSAVVVGATSGGYHADIPILAGLVLQPNWTIRASTEKAEAINVIILGGDY